AENARPALLDRSKHQSRKPGQGSAGTARRRTGRRRGNFGPDQSPKRRGRDAGPESDGRSAAQRQGQRKRPLAGGGRLRRETDGQETERPKAGVRGSSAQGSRSRQT